MIAAGILERLKPLLEDKDLEVQCLATFLILGLVGPDHNSNKSEYTPVRRPAFRKLGLLIRDNTEAQKIISCDPKWMELLIPFLANTRGDVQALVFSVFYCMLLVKKSNRELVSKRPDIIDLLENQLALDYSDIQCHGLDILVLVLREDSYIDKLIQTFLRVSSYTKNPLPRLLTSCGPHTQPPLIAALCRLARYHPDDVSKLLNIDGMMDSLTELLSNSRPEVQKNTAHLVSLLQVPRLLDELTQLVEKDPSNKAIFEKSIELLGIANAGQAFKGYVANMLAGMVMDEQWVPYFHEDKVIGLFVRLLESEEESVTVRIQSAAILGNLIRRKEVRDKVCQYDNVLKNIAELLSWVITNTSSPRGHARILEKRKKSQERAKHAKRCDTRP